MRPKPSSNSPYVGISKDVQDWYEELLASPHVQAVLHIPEDEPIFVLRAQDALVQPTINAWLKIAEHNKVNLEKIKAVKHDYEMALEWQRNNPTKVKIPD